MTSTLPTTAEVNDAQRQMVDCKHTDPTMWSGHAHVRWCSTCGSIQIQPAGAQVKSWENFPWLTPSRIYGRKKAKAKP